VLVGRLHDTSGSYVSGFSTLIAFAIVGAVAIALLPRRKAGDAPPIAVFEHA
jgi:hypothetical protein